MITHHTAQNVPEMLVYSIQSPSILCSCKALKTDKISMSAHKTGVHNTLAMVLLCLQVLFGLMLIITVFA